jgi:hypothetical protein
MSEQRSIVTKIVDAYQKYSGIIVILLLGLLGYFIASNIDANKEMSRMTSSINKEREVFSVWKDSVGREHAQIKVVTEYITQIQPAMEAKLDTAAAVLRIAKNDIVTQ